MPAKKGKAHTHTVLHSTDNCLEEGVESERDAKGMCVCVCVL